VGTGIRLPDSLDWLWKRQWIDFRLWRAESSDHDAGLPQVPEALTVLRFPAPVSRAHQLICATGALLFVLGGVVMPETTPQTEVLTRAEAMGMLSFAGVLMWAVAARALLQRTFSEAKFFRFAVIGFVVTISLGLWGLYDFATSRQAFIRILPPGLFLIASPIWLFYRKKELEFWFPQFSPTKTDKSNSLAPGRNWRTLLWLTIFTLGWMVVLDPQN
jgi:hypothetical protein